ncbi:phospho-sugar glycosidase domain-containing protein [Paenibacillus sp. NRS-1782]
MTVDNYLYGRYEHELQITSTDLSAHEGVNVITPVYFVTISKID